MSRASKINYFFFICVLSKMFRFGRAMVSSPSCIHMMKTVVTMKENIIVDIESECIGCPIGQEYARIVAKSLMGKNVMEMMNMLQQPMPMNPCAGLFRKSAMYAIQQFIPHQVSSHLPNTKESLP